MNMNSLKSSDLNELPNQADLPPPQNDPIIQQDIPTATPAVQNEAAIKPIAHVDPIPQTTEAPVFQEPIQETTTAEPIRSTHEREVRDSDKKVCPF